MSFYFFGKSNHFLENKKAPTVFLNVKNKKIYVQFFFFILKMYFILNKILLLQRIS